MSTPSSRPAHPLLDPVPAAPRHSGGASPVAIVTGANHGIGAATARTLAARGARVLVTALALDEERDPAVPDTYYEGRARNPERIAETIRGDGGIAHTLGLDLAEDAAAERLYDEAEAVFGDPVRILVHNATGWVDDTFGTVENQGRESHTVSAATFDQQFRIDARSGALLIAEHARRHRQRADRWGRIVTLSSGGPNGFPGEASYGAAKAALDNYTMTAAAELGKAGITANALMPPVTDTGWVTDPVRDYVATSWEHHHVAAAAEVAAVIDWLCSDASYLVTGNRIVLR